MPTADINVFEWQASPYSVGTFSRALSVGRLGNLMLGHSTARNELCEHYHPQEVYGPVKGNILVVEPCGGSPA